ncbi:MAG: ATP-binding protein [Elainella sp. Prado103]|jgi:PAS domain S-box-containing protein|nr:ATP-binding protein [Elainella sp. Prado103]
MKELKLFLFRQNWLAKIPLWILLTIPFISQLVGSVGLVGWLSYQSGQRSVENLTNQLMHQVSVRIDERLNAYLKTPQQVVELNRMALETEELNLDNFDELETHFFRQIQVFQSLTTLAFGNVQGETIGAGRDRSGIVAAPDSLLSWEARGTAPNTRYFYAVDSQGKRLKALHVTPNFDAHQRGWYKAAMNAGKQTWSPVFPILNLPIAAVSAVTPIYQNNELKGVLTSEVLLSDINLFLYSLNFSRSGQAFIIERSGNLVATSTKEQPFVQNIAGKQLIRLQAVNSQDGVTRAATEALFEKWPNLTQIGSSQSFQFILNHQRQFIQVAPYRNQEGLDWLIVTAVPESDFMQEIWHNQQQTWLLCGLTLLLATAAGIITARWIAVPLRRLQQAANALTEGELSFPVEMGGVGEVAQLADSFQQMARQVDASFRLLQASEQRFSTLLDQIPIGISVFDPLGQHILMNRVGETILGQGIVPDLPSEQLSTTYRVYKAGTDKFYPVEQLPVIRALRGETISVDDLEVEVEGRRIPLEVHTIPVFGQRGEILYAIAAFTDITERKQTQQLLADYNRILETQVAERTEAVQQQKEILETLFEHIPVMLAFHQNGTLLLVNQEFERVLGWLFNELISIDLLDAAYPDPEERQQVIEHIQAATGTWQDFHTRRKDGQYVEVSWANIHLSDGRQISIGRDVTHRKQLDRIKDEFISVVSHELRTPLTAIRGALGLLQSGFYQDKPETATELLRVALNNSERLVRLVNDILDLERLESGKTKLVKEPCNVADLMQQAIESVQMLAEQSHIQMVSHPLSIQIEADSDAIVQTLTNLLSNAIKFSPIGSKVWLNASLPQAREADRATEQVIIPPSHLLFSVKDQGCGIPPDKLDAVFARFQQVNVSDSRKKGGTGLGLAICKSIIEQHGGQIWVESGLGEGSTFYFTLPVSD